jgi:mRNA interferase RelE/StbE
MADYEIVFSRSARKELEALPAIVIRKILNKIEALTANPRPPGCEKLKGSENLWRIRSGDYRIIYSIEDKTKLLDIIFVRNRKDAYR